MSLTPRPDFVEELKDITRVEIIDDLGRMYVAAHGTVKSIRASFQDDNKTLKLFITKHAEKAKG